MIGVTVLGATGSIGASTLDVLARHPERYRIHALTAHRNVTEMVRLCERHRPSVAVMVDRQAAAQLAEHLSNGPAAGVVVQGGQAALAEVAAAPETDRVMAAIVGAAGLLPTLAAVRAGKTLLLANKEALVVAGDLFVREAVAHQATVLPVDSEHNAIFQCLPSGGPTLGRREGVRRIILTASGGPFRDTPIEQLATVTPEQACAHPNWDMGRKISVDSATMMNKGLEVIEAHHLFGLPTAQIDVLVHRQSIVHSLVEYEDGSLLAQMGAPDMRIPIAHALAWPDRMPSGAQRLDLAASGGLDFVEPDLRRFPCLALAFQAATSGGTAPAVLNAANEVAVAAFLERKIGFTAIADQVDDTLQRLGTERAESLDSVLAADARARELTAHRLGLSKTVAQVGI